jgi:hypothetical protein
MFDNVKSFGVCDPPSSLRFATFVVRGPLTIRDRESVLCREEGTYEPFDFATLYFRDDFC